MRMRACGWAERCHIVPSPHAGEGQGGGYNRHGIFLLSETQRMLPRFLGLCARVPLRLVLHRHPPPCPSPAWGEGTVWHAPSQLSAADSEMCASPSAQAGTHTPQRGHMARLAI